MSRKELISKIGDLEQENSILRIELKSRNKLSFFSDALSENTDNNQNDGIDKTISIQKEFEKREMLLSEIYENAPFMLFGVNKKGEAVFWNKTLEKSVGWKKEELGVFPGFFSNFFIDDAELQRIHRDYVSGDKIFREYSVTDKSGKIHIHQWASFLIGDNLYAAFGYDITERKRLEREREELLADFETIFNNTSIGIGELKNGRFFNRINKRGCEILGYEEDELKGQSVEIIHVSEKEFSEFGENNYNRLVNGKTIHTEQQFRKKDGTVIWCSVYGKAILPPDLDKGVIWVVDDITEKKIYEKKLYYMAIKDDLTSLYNRRYFFEKAENIIGRVKRYKKDLSAAIIDIDHFKYINDSFGHDIGDRVLKKIAETINQCIRETDLLARYGGEEFVLLMEETDIKSAENVLERIRIKVSGLYFDNSENISLSAGCTSWKEGDTIDEMLKRADKALYMAKENGRNRIEYFIK